MSAIFNFQSLLSVILLLICTCAYLRSFFPSIIDRNKTGKMELLAVANSVKFIMTNGTILLGTFWKCARIGERKSPYVATCCVIMAFTILFLT